MFQRKEMTKICVPLKKERERERDIKIASVVIGA